MRFIKDEDGDIYEDAGRSFSDLVQFGLISHTDRLQKTVEVTEARRK
jgi:hypothetical protein